jgi:hypothetical protein
LAEVIFSLRGRTPSGGLEAMDFQFRSVADTCALSGRAFVPGDRVWSVLYLAEDGSTARMDLAADQLEAASLPGRQLCKWQVLIREKAETEAQARKAATMGVEELFMQLVDAAEGDAEDPQVVAARSRMLFLLALQLERRRVLRAHGQGRYLHIKSKRLIQVPDLDITPELIRQLHQEKDSLPVSGQQG